MKFILSRSASRSTDMLGQNGVEIIKESGHRSNKIYKNILNICDCKMYVYNITL